MHNRVSQFSDDALRLKAIIDTASDGIIIIDDRGIMELINPAAARLFGYQIEEITGHNISILMPEPHRGAHDHYINNYLTTGQAKIIGIGREVEGLKKDGTVFPFRLSISEVRLREKRIFTGIVHDLTEQKATEKALKHEKERAQQYLDVANTIIVVIDREEKVQLLNKKGYELLGYPEGSLLGENWFDLVINSKVREKVRSAFHQSINKNKPIIDYFENEILTHEGTSRLMAWRNALLKDDSGEVIATISSGVDITEQKAAENSLRELNTELEKRVYDRTEELAEAVNQLLDINKQLEVEIVERKAAEQALLKSQDELQKAYEKEKELNELKSRFVSMASHEFRTPLSTILSSSDLVEAYQKEEQQHKRLKHINRIKSSVSNMIGILNDFLSLSRLEEGRIEEKPVTFNLEAFCLDVEEQMQGLLKPDQNIKCEITLTHPTINLDKKLLQNIMFNLMSNAIKYSENGKTITLRVNQMHEHLTVEVIDQGIGIPEEEQQHLFTRFFRARNVENIQGTGLGLNIVKRYVELMKGNITFESIAGEGTTFKVVIPLKK